MDTNWLTFLTNMEAITRCAEKLPKMNEKTKLKELLLWERLSEASER